MEDVIITNFYLFQGWHQSKYIVKLYMNFIDQWFNNAFSNLKLRIVQYDYPNNIEYGSGAMIDYINDHYGVDSNKVNLDIDQEIQIELCHSSLLGDIEIILNGIVMESYLDDEMEVGIFNCSQRGFDYLHKLANCIMDKQISATFHKMIDAINNVADSAIAFHYKENKYWGVTDEEMGFNTTYFPLYELLCFVYDQMNS
jgi:hypothetical protein